MWPGTIVVAGVGALFSLLLCGGSALFTTAERYYLDYALSHGGTVDPDALTFDDSEAWNARSLLRAKECLLISTGICCALYAVISYMVRTATENSSNLGIGKKVLTPKNIPARGKAFDIETQERHERIAKKLQERKAARG